MYERLESRTSSSTKRVVVGKGSGLSFLYQLVENALVPRAILFMEDFIHHLNLIVVLLCPTGTTFTGLDIRTVETLSKYCTIK